MTSDNSVAGLGLYRHFYKEFGSEFWGNEPAKFVKKFLSLENDLANFNVLDLGAGTGKNTFAFANKGCAKIIAVEIDSYASFELLKSLIKLEENKLIEEGIIEIYKADVISFLSDNNAQFDCIIAYGLLHVFKEPKQVDQLLSLIAEHLVSGGYLILQSLTDKFPAPALQKELEGTFINLEYLYKFFNINWEVIELDQEDIIHSHLQSEEDHKHGSIRMLLRKK